MQWSPAIWPITAEPFVAGSLPDLFAQGVLISPLWFMHAALVLWWVSRLRGDAGAPLLASRVFWGGLALFTAVVLPLGVPVAARWGASLLLCAGALQLMRGALCEAPSTGGRLLLFLLRLTVLPALLALVPWALAGDWGGAAVTTLPALWLAVATLLACAGAALWQHRPGWPAVCELVLVLGVQGLLWFGYGHAQASQVPLELCYAPLYLWAAGRFGMAGPLAVYAGAWTLAWLGHPQPVATADALSGALLSAVSVTAALMLSLASARLRRQEQALRDSHARFEALINQSPNIMAIKDLDGRYLLANQACASLLGVPQSAVIGRRAGDFLPPVLAGQLEALAGRVRASREVCQQEEQVVLGEEASTWLATMFPLFDSGGRLSGLGTIASDVTGIKREEQARGEMIDQYRAVVEQSLVGIFIQQDGRIVYLNRTLAEMGGYRAEELSGVMLYDYLVPEEVERIARQIQLRKEQKVKVMRFSTRLRHRNGSAVDIEVHSRLIEYRGEPAFIGVAIDVSDRVSAQTELRLAAKVFENSAEGILITDATGCIITVNQAFTRITGYRYEEAAGRVSRMFRGVDGGGALLAELSRTGFWSGEMYDKRKDGEWYPAELTLSAVREADGAISNYVGVFTDITERKLAEERLHFLANHDPLTGLPNRSHLIGHLDNALAGGSADDEFRLALMFIDLDRFKLINDSFGHQAGDGLLTEISARLTRICGRYGMVARLGGDEFTLIVEDYRSREQLCAIADEVLAELAKPLLLETQELFVTASIGVSVYPGDGIDARTLLKNADVAMYRAKEQGKNTFQFFNADMNSQTVERLLLENALRQALEKGEFELHYQPQLSPLRGELLGVETLIRWRHPQLGLVSPVRFIPLAEETGLIKQIGAWVLREACLQIARWDASGVFVPRVAVNLSARQFEQADLVSLIDGALEAAGIDASRLEVELTESLLMQKPEEAVLVLRQLKALGVTLALDDFGTGYSSLSMLKRFPLDTLKIDRSFVEGLPGDDDSVAIAQAIVAMARKLRYTVVAEGVETAAQSAFLRDNGCNALQGYLFSRPLPAAELPACIDRLAVAARHAAEVEYAAL